MATRYDPLSGSKMLQTQSGRYITYAEHDELVRELLETIGEYFRQVEHGETTAADAETVVQMFVRLRE